MTRNLRRRHLFIWIVIGLIILPLLIYAYLNTPEFPGEKEKIETSN